jgi:hypothetical protein
LFHFPDKQREAAVDPRKLGRIESAEENNHSQYRDYYQCFFIVQNYLLRKPFNVLYVLISDCIKELFKNNLYIFAILPDAFGFAGTQSNSSFQLEQSQEVAKTTGPAIAGSRDCGNACSTLF